MAVAGAACGGPVTGAATASIAAFSPVAFTRAPLAVASIA
jgi:hypothetical protein